MKLKTIKIIYWVSTGIFSAVFGTNGTLYLLHNASMADKFKYLGYPPYLMIMLGVAKLIGVLFLLLPKYPRLKEWVYAGFAIDLYGAVWSHAALQGVGWSLRLLLPITILTVSYISFRKLQAVKSGSKTSYVI